MTANQRKTGVLQEMLAHFGNDESRARRAKLHEGVLRRARPVLDRPGLRLSAAGTGNCDLSHSQHKKDAAAFLAYLRTRETRELLRKYGFAQP